MKLKLSLFLFVIFFQVIFVQRCVNYYEFPENYIGKSKAEKKNPVILYYKVLNGTISGGSTRLKDYLKRESPFIQTEQVDKIPEKGLYLNVNIQQRLPSIYTLIFGYLSVATLTLLPVWSNEDGSDVLFQIYRDGQLEKSYEYPVRRSGFLWILMLPFAWVNAYTYSEAQAFEAIANKFFEDSAPVLQK
ncbi:LIC12231 family lipoprotein [Leptospira stimsonii]|uniref:Lipoprotein n=1 Tax=Leptospira stimsonii TaxID=2202203 RepID=A0A8B3CQ11_9LEPT|nr:hypothetical protein [Leptospira stimsonii]RHX84423.1 hypothetical protein DLM78_16930 [Leptospira stimsonii]